MEKSAAVQVLLAEISPGGNEKILVAIEYAESRVVPLLAVRGALALVLETDDETEALIPLEIIGHIANRLGDTGGNDLWDKLKQELPNDLFESFANHVLTHQGAAYLLGLLVGMRLAR